MEWQVADTVLWQLLKGWLLALIPQRPFLLALYTNQMMGPLSQNWGDYVQPTPTQWPGYNMVVLEIPNWTDPQVTDHVATITQPTPATFNLGSGVAPVTIWGYAVSDSYANYLWSSQFAQPLEVPSPGVVSLVVSFNIAVLPDTDDAPQVRFVTRPIEFAGHEED